MHTNLEVLADIMTLCVLLFAFVLSFPAWVLQGYVISKLWKWFVVPTFGVQEISTLRAMGLTLITFMLVPILGASTINEGWLGFIEACMLTAGMIVIPLLTLMMGAGVKQLETWADE